MPCCLAPCCLGDAVGQTAISDPATWSEAMLEARRPFVSETSKRGRSAAYTVERAVSQMRAIPVVPLGWKPGADGLPLHPQDNHRAYFFFRFQPADSSEVPLQAMHVVNGLSQHPSWETKWYSTAEGKVYHELPRNQQRYVLLLFLQAQVAAGGGKKRKRAKAKVKGGGSASDAEEPDCD